MADRVLDVALAVFLSLVYFASSLPKLHRPRAFFIVVASYEIPPSTLGRLYGSILPPLELLTALLLVSGTDVALAAGVSAVLLATFMGVGALNLWRGRETECNCFGRLWRRRTGWAAVAQNASLFAASAVLLDLGSGRGWISVAAWSPLHYVIAAPVGSGGPVQTIVCLAAAGIVSAALRVADAAGSSRRAWARVDQRR